MAFNCDFSSETTKKMGKIFINSTQCHEDEVEDLLSYNVFNYVKTKLSKYYRNEPISEKAVQKQVKIRKLLQKVYYFVTKTSSRSHQEKKLR